MPHRPEISPEHHTGATHSGRSPHISPKAPPSTSVKAPCWSPAGSRRLERGSGYGLRPGEGVCIAFFLQTSSLDPLPSRDKPKQGPRPAESLGDLSQRGKVTSSYSTTAREGWGRQWPLAGFFEEKSATAIGKEDFMSWIALKLRGFFPCIITFPNKEFLGTWALGVWSWPGFAKFRI